jgi:hypothetical protein
MELRGPIAGYFLALLVILAGIHEGGAILGGPGQLVKFLGTTFLEPLPGGLSRSSQPLEPDGQTFVPCRAPGTTIAAAVPSTPSQSQTPVAMYMRSIGFSQVADSRHAAFCRKPS